MRPIYRVALGVGIVAGVLLGWLLLLAAGWSSGAEVTGPCPPGECAVCDELRRRKAP